MKTDRKIRLCLIAGAVLLAFGYEFPERPAVVSVEIAWAVSKVKSAIFIAAVIVMSYVERKDET